MDKKELTEKYLQILERNASRAFHEYKSTRTKVMSLYLERKVIASQLKALHVQCGVPISDMGIESQITMEDVFGRETDEDEFNKTIKTVNEIISNAYNQGKYDGREMVGLFRGLFEMIGPSALIEFDQSRS